MSSPRVAVVGAGVAGVATAYNIKKLCPGAQVTIMAKEFSPNTTSDVAAGICLLYLLRDTPLQSQRRWFKKTLDYLFKLHQTEEGPRAGVQMVSAYMMDSSGKQEAELQLTEVTNSCLGHRRMTLKELEAWPSMKSGICITTLMCECYLYLPWLLNKFKELGGIAIHKLIENMEELYEEYDIVVNCCGIGAYKVCGDTSLEPVRGQVYRVLAPWIQQAFIFEEETIYIIPGRNNVVVGGTSDAGNWDLVPSEKDKERIWRETLELMPSMANATIIKAECGLRPTRTEVRLEIELVTYKHRTKPVIHNYGHGGSGVTIHWGCATEAAELVQSTVRKHLQHQPAKL